MLSPITSRTCTGKRQALPFCRMRLTKTPGAWWVLEESVCKNRNSFGLQFFLLAILCSDLSLMRGKPEREGGRGRKKMLERDMSTSRGGACPAAQWLSTSVAHWQPQSHPAWDGDSSCGFTFLCFKVSSRAGTWCLLGLLQIHWL